MDLEQIVMAGPKFDEAVSTKTDHEDASLVRTIKERLAQADAPDAVWIDAEDVFKDLDALLLEASRD